MSVLLTYCLKLSVSLALVSLFYQLLLRRLTFYNWNRYYLFGYSLLSFLIAFIDISPVLQHNELINTGFVKWIPVLDSPETAIANTGNADSFTTPDAIGLMLVAGIGVMFFRLLLHLFSFKRIMKKAEFVTDEGMKFYQVNDSIIPFSFGNSIFLNRNLHTEDELKEIIQHEFVHVKQRHSIDIILAEVVCLFNWYNPFAWLLRSSIRQNLEFIADSKVLQNGVGRKEYQYLLLKVVGNNQFSIAPKFNFSSLKKRIAMMNKLKSARMNLVRFLFVLPLVVVLLLAFRTIGPGRQPTRIDNQKNISAIESTVTDTIPKPSKASQQAPANKSKISVVSDKYEINDDKAVIHLHDGTTEEYDLKNKEERRKFEDKYGKIINTSAGSEAMTTVTAITDEGVATAVAPVTVTSIGSGTGIGKGRGNGNGNGNGNGSIHNNTAVAVISSGKTATTIVSPVTVNAEGTTVVGEGVAVANGYEGEETGHEEVLITITKNTTRPQLEEFKKQMKEKGIELSFDDIEYDNNGVLKKLNGSMKSSDANSSFAAAGFNKLIISIVTNGDHTYFKVRTTSNKTVI